MANYCRAGIKSLRGTMTSLKVPSFTIPFTSLVPYLYCSSVHHYFTCGKIKGAFTAYDIDSVLMGARNFETGFPVSAGGPALRGLEPPLPPASLCRLPLLLTVRA
jgi:hypothetical protein